MQEIVIEFPRSEGATIRYRPGSWVGVAEANRLYVLRAMMGEELGHLRVNKAFALNTGAGATKEATQWHCRLAHLSVAAVHRLWLEDNEISSIRTVSHSVCASCMYGKMARKPFPSVYNLER